MIESKYIDNFKKNITKNEEFYKVFIINLSFDDTIYYDGKNPLFKSNFPNFVLGNNGEEKFCPSIAYKDEDNNLYDIFTDRKMNIIKKGVNHIGKEELLICENIELSSNDYVEKFLNIILSENRENINYLKKKKLVKDQENL